MVLREKQEGDMEEIESWILLGLIVQVEDGGGEGERWRLEVVVELEGKIKRKKNLRGEEVGWVAGYGGHLGREEGRKFGFFLFYSKFLLC